LAALPAQPDLFKDVITALFRGWTEEAAKVPSDPGTEVLAVASVVSFANKVGSHEVDSHETEITCIIPFVSGIP
jgi:hypothetical protein